MTDTVGFIQKLPSTLVAAFMATLEELEEASLILHVVDISHPKAEEHASVVNRLLKRLGLDMKSSILVLNKIDLVNQDSYEVGEYAERLTKNRENVDVIVISAEQKAGLANLIQAINEKLTDGQIDYSNLGEWAGVRDRE